MIAGLTGFAVLQTLSICALVNLPLLILLIDSLIYCLLYFLVSIPLLHIIQYGKLDTLNFYVKIINYVALAILTIGITTCSGYLIEYLFFDVSYRSIFAAMIPFHLFLSMLAYLLIVLIDHKSTEETNNEMIKDTSEVTTKPIPIERIAIKSGIKIHVVPINEIIYMITDGDYVQVVTEKGKFLKEQTMKYYQTHLPDNQFVRVHRSYFVNIEAISRIELYEKHNQQLLLKNGDKIKVSQAGYKLLREKLGL